VAAQAPLGLLGAISFKSIEWYVVRRSLEQQREQAQLQIREQAALLDKAQDAIMVHDLGWRSTYWNPSAERLYGWTAAEAQEKSIAELLYQRDVARFAEARDAVMNRGEWIGRLRQTTRADKELLVESRWTRVCDESGQPKSVLVINTDITERSKLESQLLRTQRMESIGTVAGGIAHDLNNVLTPILMGAQLVEAREVDESKKHTLRSIVVSAQRGADMVKQVLTFARGQEGEKVILQLKHVIRDMEEITRETFPKSIEVNATIARDLRPIKGDATQLHQVLLNLCVNARDAMPEGGRILIEAENVSLDEGSVRHFLGAEPGAYIRLRVQDTGTGIPQEIIDRIFEPFFTTKEIGKGTGLGLSTVLSIVKSHGAFMDVASVVGKGTTFTILFPQAASDAAAQSSEAKKLNTAGDGRLVLVVDDEPIIREMLESLLKENGYQVLTAEDGLRGVAAFKARASDISVVMIDMMMPVMDGTKAIPAMVQIHPDTRFVAITGLALPAELAKQPYASQIEVLGKPFTSEKVLETLARVSR
jgi:PAS domain S-box-containing protein